MLKSRKDASKKTEEKMPINLDELRSIKREISAPAAEGDTTRVFALVAEAEIYSHGDKSIPKYRKISIARIRAS